MKGEIKTVKNLAMLGIQRERKVKTFCSMRDKLLSCDTLDMVPEPGHWSHWCHCHCHSARSGQMRHQMMTLSSWWWNVQSWSQTTLMDP